MQRYLFQTDTKSILGFEYLPILLTHKIKCNELEDGLYFLLCYNKC